MNIIKYVLVLFSFIVFISCNNSTEPNYFVCQNLSIGLINMDQDLLAAELNKILPNMTPKTTPNDPYGHEENITNLINQINSECENIEAELICYACIKTFPPQSEILLTTDSVGVSINRTIDILTPSDDKLSFVRIHN